MLHLLEDQYSGAFAHNKAVASSVERTGRSLGRIVALGQSLHVGKAADRHRCHRRLGATADHDVGVAVLNGSERITYRMSTRSASRDCGVVWAFGVELHRDNAGGDVSDEHGDEERRDL